MVINSLRFIPPMKNVILITSTKTSSPERNNLREINIMKNVKYAVAAIALSALSFGAFAAQPVTQAQAQKMNEMGTVSVDGATTLDGMEAQLAQKAAAAGATGYAITSANTNNKVSGTAVIYK